MSDDPEFNVGDVVRLKSGGPLMTIAWIGERYGTPAIGCSWFQGVKHYEDAFAPGALKHSEPARAFRTI
jgi:uncharacterized protein YodC (DUF2158 family)